MENKSKANLFIGFAIRTGKYKIGVNAIGTMKRSKLLIVCKTTAENSLDQAKKFSKKFHCPLLMTVTDTLETITFKENAKLMAIDNKELAEAILANYGNDFTQIL